MFPRNISIPDFKVEPCRQRSRDHIHYRISEENKEKLLTFIIHQNLKTKEVNFYQILGCETNEH